jgi:hypothetical protein
MRLRGFGRFQSTSYCSLLPLLAVGCGIAGYTLFFFLLNRLEAVYLVVRLGMRVVDEQTRLTLRRLGNQSINQPGKNTQKPTNKQRHNTFLAK